MSLQTPGGDSTPSDGQSWSAFSDLEVVYEQRSLSEPIRLGKNGRVLGMALNVITESNLAVWTSDGRVCLVDVQQGELQNAGFSPTSPICKVVFTFQRTTRKWLPPGTKTSDLISRV